MKNKLHMSLWNNIGTSTEPWGASDRICIRYFSSFFSQMFGNLKQTWRSYCERKSYAFSFPINNLCGRQSKAFERSVSKSPKTCSLFTLSFLSGGIGIKSLEVVDWSRLPAKVSNQPSHLESAAATRISPRYSFKTSSSFLKLFKLLQGFWSRKQSLNQWWLKSGGRKQSIKIMHFAEEVLKFTRYIKV